MRRGLLAYLMLGIMVIALITAPLTALADNINNSITNAAAGTITAGSSMVAQYWISAQPRPQDGEDGCNATVASPLTLTINVPTGATATPSELTFTACGTNAGDANAQAVTFSSSTAGTYAVTHTSSNSGTGSYTNNANFTLIVEAGGDTNAPTVSLGVPDPTGLNGWNTTAPVVLTVTASDTNPVSTLTCTINGSPAILDGIAGLPTNSVTALLSVSAEGISDVSCVATDTGGNSSIAAVAQIKIDTVAPSISASLDKTADVASGWYNIVTGAPTVSFTCSDASSGLAGACPTASTFGEGADQLRSETISDLAGNSASADVSDVDVDLTAPTASASASPAVNGNGWNNSDVTVSFSGSDGLSGIASCAADAVLSDEGAGQYASGTCTDNAGNVSTSATASNINIDKTAPTASASASPAANGNGWNNSDVTVDFSGTDALSGIDSCSTDAVLSNEGAGQYASGTCTDNAGNVSTSATASNINIDKTAPTLSPAVNPNPVLLNGIATATSGAADALSGLASQSCTAPNTSSVGLKSVTCNATDNAGNTASAAASYTVVDYTFSGFYQPVDMGGVVNTVKNGSGVPLKFELFEGSTELTDTSLIRMTAVKVNCISSATEAPVEELTSVSTTSLRYDITAGQFIFNWKTPKTANICYDVTATAGATSITAKFRLK